MELTLKQAYQRAMLIVLRYQEMDEEESTLGAELYSDAQVMMNARAGIEDEEELTDEEKKKLLKLQRKWRQELHTRELIGQEKFERSKEHPWGKWKVWLTDKGREMVAFDVTKDGMNELPWTIVDEVKTAKAELSTLPEPSFRIKGANMMPAKAWRDTVSKVKNGEWDILVVPHERKLNVPFWNEAGE